MIFSLKNKLIRDLKIKDKSECAFDVVGKISMRGFNGIHLVRFGFRM